LEERFDVNFGEQDEMELPANLEALGADFNGLQRFSGVSGVSGLNSAADGLGFDNDGLEQEFDKQEYDKEEAYSDDFETGEPAREALIIED